MGHHGDGKTALHTSAGLYYNAHITAKHGRAANNPPAENTPSIFYGTMDTLFQGAAFSQRPSNVFGLERDAKTPRSYNYSVGIQRELGWGTVVDVLRIPEAARRSGAEHQLSPMARASWISTRRTAIRSNDDRQAGGVPAAVSRLSGHQHQVTLRHI